MGNLTISLDDAVIQQARVRAIQEGTSVSAKVREFLMAYTQQGTPSQTTASMPSPTHQSIDPANELLQLMAQVRAEARPMAATDADTAPKPPPAPTTQTF